MKNYLQFCNNTNIFHSVMNTHKYICRYNSSAITEKLMNELCAQSARLLINLDKIMHIARLLQLSTA